MVGYPAAISKSILFKAIPIGLAINGVLLGTGFAGIKLAYNYAVELEINLKEDIAPLIMLGSGIGFLAGFTIIGEYLLHEDDMVDYLQ